jgi:hypothetical protein
MAMMQRRDDLDCVVMIGCTDGVCTVPHPRAAYNELGCGGAWAPTRTRCRAPIFRRRMCEDADFVMI